MKSGMKNINSYRKFKRNDKEVNTDGEYILYWMQVNRRFHYNYALEYAIALSNKYDKPLLIYEGLNVGYPWASDRFHTFIMQGMKENLDFANEKSLNFYSYLEPEHKADEGFSTVWLKMQLRLSRMNIQSLLSGLTTKMWRKI